MNTAVLGNYLFEDMNGRTYRKNKNGTFDMRFKLGRTLAKRDYLIKKPMIDLQKALAKKKALAKLEKQKTLKLIRFNVFVWKSVTILAAVNSFVLLVTNLRILL